jgi:mono/diheme cytochrome c family protein
MSIKIVLVVFVLIITGIFLGLQQDISFKESKARGAVIYQGFCVTCHLPTGEGVPEVYPPLANSDYLLANKTASIRGIKFGQRGPMVVNGITYDNTMMPLGLEEQEIADVMNFILTSWGNTTEKMVTPEEVAEVGPR